jgi:hypothetical protein
MKANELRLELLLLGFTKNTLSKFGTLIDSYTLNGFTVYYSSYSDNWFYIVTARNKSGGSFRKPSKKLTTDNMYLYIMKKLGIQDG